MGIQVASKDSTKMVRTLDAGQAFGELALLKAGGRRAASVITTMASEFLTIDGQQYQQLLAQLQREELCAKMDVLRRAPMFRSATLLRIYQWGQHSSQTYTVIVKHTHCSGVYSWQSIHSWPEAGSEQQLGNSSAVQLRAGTGAGR